ncbi:response regulator [Coleofasciculus sp. G1-WW12-02]|uniref:response regulator n=1 Tax=Coleofasciculus sp. G1-WW12-02 TaxID=3068483 RepID=UPI0040647479
MQSTPLTKNHQTRILLAEDNRVNQKFAVLLLKKLGYQADVVSNGAEVLQALHSHSYDVVFMDVEMPEMDGLTATRQICEQWSVHERPRIIALTAYAQRGEWMTILLNRLSCQNWFRRCRRYWIVII